LTSARQVREHLRFYAAATRRVRANSHGPTARLFRSEQRLVFVVGCPRSGTTFLAGAVGSLPGFVDLGEVTPLKAAIPGLTGLGEEEAARRLRAVLERVRRLALVRGLRGVEQTPEVSYLVPAVLHAYPEASLLHIVRDGRDVACSLLERGWLSESRSGRDDAHASYGARARFWVEPDRAREFEQASDATRAAWAWRRYLTAARNPDPRLLELRYEQLAEAPEPVAEEIARQLELEPEPVRRALSGFSGRSVGRWRRDLTSEQLADVEREAGPLLRELGYLE
jgi:hypothetical protein